MSDVEDYKLLLRRRLGNLEFAARVMRDSFCGDSWKLCTYQSRKELRGACINVDAAVGDLRRRLSEAGVCSESDS